MGGHRRGGRHQPRPVGRAAAAEVVPAVRAPRGNQALRPDMEAVTRAIRSLYLDQLKPFGRILRKRIAEQASGVALERLYVAPGGGLVPLPEVDVVHLRAICESCTDFRIQPEEGGDWSAVVVGRPEAFVDVYSLDDTYPPELWAKAEVYFKSLVAPERSLPGGRYACAQALMSRRLDFLTTCSLGQVCHIVQLAITQRKALGYCNGAIVAYSESQSMMKEQCAVQQQPCVSSDVAVMPLACWEVARAYLKEILQSAAPADQGPALVPLSNIKRLFRSRYQTELSETMLGHSRLSDLIQDEHFHDLCSLELHKNGYVVVQRLPPICTRISLADSLPEPVAETGASRARGLQLGEREVDYGSTAQQLSVKPVPFCVDDPLCFDDLGQAGIGDAAFLPMSTPLPSPGVPASATVKHWLGEPHRLAFSPEEPLSVDESPIAEPRRVAFCPDEPLCLEDATPFEDVATMEPLSVRTPLPSPGEPPSATVRRWTGLADFFAAEPSCLDSSRQRLKAEPPVPLALSTPLPSPGVPPSATARRWSDAPRRIEFCPDEPLCLDEGIFDAPTPLASPGVPGSATVRRWAGEPHHLGFFPERPAVAEAGAPPSAVPASPHAVPSPSNRRHLCGLQRPEHRAELPASPVPPAAPTPDAADYPSFAFALSALSGAGGLVQNTFIHAKLPPPTPLLTRRRAQSAPRSTCIHRGEPVEAAPRAASPAAAAPTSALQIALAGLEPLEEPAPLTLHQDSTSPVPSPAARLSGSLVHKAAASPRWLVASPVDGCTKLTVRNTFIHSSPAPREPAAQRSRSAPPGGNPCGATAGALGRALRALPRLLSGIESKCDIALTPASCKSPVADALPAFVPLSPALTASPTDCGYSWLLAPRPMAGIANRVVRLADHL
mmetsp:Transcript_21773/g.61833  ORF Transcript_21773/g.61833 Transcript_21773/m.61833 type:complete len:895 (+) Transcript_21773:95-2779(+)